MGVLLYGGSFDPFHNGHYHMLRLFSDLTEIHTILLMPSYQTPKKERSSVPAKERLMALRAVSTSFPNRKKNPVSFIISDYEIMKKGVSWTIQTLVWLKETYPDQPLYLGLGSDTFFSLHKWRAYKEIGRAHV